MVRKFFSRRFPPSFRPGRRRVNHGEKRTRIMKLSKSRSTGPIARNFWNSILSARVSPASKQYINDLDEPIDTARELMDAAIKSLETFLASRHLLQALEESALIQMGDYWIICYQGHPAIFKATRGLD